MYIFIIMIVVLLSIYLFSNFITPEKPIIPDSFNNYQVLLFCKYEVQTPL